MILIKEPDLGLMKDCKERVNMSQKQKMTKVSLGLQKVSPQL